MIGCTVLSVLLVATALMAVPSFARFLTQEELRRDPCFSETQTHVSHVSIVTVPTGPVEVMMLTDAHSKFEITCMKVFEIGPSLPPSQQTLCLASPSLEICTSEDPGKSASGIPLERYWKCVAAMEYQSNPQTSTVIGSQKATPVNIRINMIANNPGAMCYPRDVTFLFTGMPIVPVPSNLAANIFFILLVVVIGIVLTFFATYQFRKVMQKFLNKQKRRPAGEHLSAKGASNTLKALGECRPTARAQGGDAATVDIYDEYDTPAGGTHQIIIEAPDGGMVQIASKPLPKPWFERANYRTDDASLQDTSAARRRQQRRPIAASPESIHHEARVDAAQNVIYDEQGDRVIPLPSSAQFYEGFYEEGPESRGVVATDEEGIDLVLTCTDCLLPIRDEKTPQICEVTGKRHY